MRSEFSLFLFYTVFTIFCNGFHSFSLDIRSKNRDNLFKQKVRYTYIFTNNMKMACKIINLSIPEDRIIPEEIHSFSPEENYQMIKIGSECLLEGRKVIANLSQREIYEKIKEESKDEIQKKEMDLMVEREMSKKMEDRISKMYQGQLEQMKKQLDLMKQQLSVYESENKDVIQKHVEKEREKYDLLLQEKDRQNNLNREVFDKAEKLLNKNKYKSSKSKGDDGEEQFTYLSDTFKDFNGYKIEDKSKQGHKGDFHLFFDEFNVLVDLKNYSDSVQKKEIEKIEMDLITNDNMNYAWLISLDSDICGWNRFQIMNKWIMTDTGMKCIIFVNNLLENKDPKNTLRLIWSICNEFNKLISVVDKDDEELKLYKERDFNINKKIKILQERNTEMRRNINTSFNILKNMDSDLIDLLSLVSNEIINNECEKYRKISDWFVKNIDYMDNNDEILTSTEVWSRFKKENKEFILKKNITIEIFKETLIKIVDNTKYIERTKKGAIDLIGFKFKENEQIIESVKNDVYISNVDFFSPKTKSKEIIEIDEEEIINNVIVKNNSKKLVKNNDNQFYFDKKIDNKILKEYEDINKNIMIISSNNNIRPWEVVSLLMKHKIIKKRDESRGYDVYKETDEYKEKLKIK